MLINLYSLNNESYASIKRLFSNIPLTETVLTFRGKFDSSCDSKKIIYALNYLPKTIILVKFIAELKIEPVYVSYNEGIRDHSNSRVLDHWKSGVGNLLKKYVSSLPETVQKLSFDFTNPADAPASRKAYIDTYSYVDELTNVVKSIPKTIQELNLDSINIHRAECIAKHLPNTVQAFHIKVPDPIYPNSLLGFSQSINRNLTKITLRGGSVNLLSDRMYLFDRIFRNLPPNLKELDLSNNPLHHLRLGLWQKMFDALPKNLSFLGLSKTLVDSDDNSRLTLEEVTRLLAQIPKTVHTLDLSENTLLLCAPEQLQLTLFGLSKSITRLRLTETNLRGLNEFDLGARLACLPSQISTFSLSNSNLFNLSVEKLLIALHYLPTTIHTLDISNTRLNKKTTSDLIALFSGTSEHITTLILRDNKLASLELEKIKQIFSSLPSSVSKIDLSCNGFDRLPATQFRAFITAFPAALKQVIFDKEGVALQNNGALVPRLSGFNSSSFFKPLNTVKHQAILSELLLPMLQWISQGAISWDALTVILSYLMPHFNKELAYVHTKLERSLISSIPPQEITPRIQQECLAIIQKQIHSLADEETRLDLSRCGLNRLDNSEILIAELKNIPKSVISVSFRGNGFQNREKGQAAFFEALAKLPHHVLHLDLSDHGFEDYSTKQLQALFKNLAPTVQLVSLTQAPPVSPQHHLARRSRLAAYRSWCNNQPNGLSKMRYLLNDYTKRNSPFLRVITGHWNRHHADKIARIIHFIDSGFLKTAEDVLTELEQIPLKNPAGSLAKRFTFLEQVAREEQKNNSQGMVIEMTGPSEDSANQLPWETTHA